MLRTITIAAFFATTGWGCAANKVDSVYGDTGNNLLHNPGPEHIDGDDCSELTVEAGGRNLDNIAEPEVGDIWELRMFCDGVLMTGANLLKFTPPNVAVVDTEMTNATLSPRVKPPCFCSLETDSTSETWWFSSPYDALSRSPPSLCKLLPRPHGG